MAWRDNLKKASFKKAAFYVDSHAVTKGRRVPVRRLAGRDGSVQQDLGKEPNEFDLVAYLWGDDYDTARDKLEDALAQTGPGALIIPTRGELWVRVTRGPVTHEQRTEGGYCTVRFSCVEEEREGGGLLKKPATAAGLLAAAKNLKAAAASGFGKAVSIAGMPGKFISATVAAIGKVTSTLRNITRQATSAMNVLDRVTSALDELDNAINSLLSLPSLLATKLIDLINTALGIVDTIVNGIDRITGLFKDSDPSAFKRSASTRATRHLASMLFALGQEDKDRTGNTALAQQETVNTRAVYRLTRSVALARAAETYAVAPFDSTQLATGVLEAMSAEIDALAEYGETDDDLYQALVELRAAASAHLLQTASSLPDAVSYTPARELPVILIAHDIYADARQETEIIARNRVRHPLFVSGALEIVRP